MYITLNAYLEGLEATERSKPEGARRSVPTMRELAEVAGISAVSMSRLATGKVNSLNFDTGAAIITEMRRRGFDTEIGDFVAYRPPLYEAA